MGPGGRGRRVLQPEPVPASVPVRRSRWVSDAAGGVGRAHQYSDIAALTWGLGLRSRLPVWMAASPEVVRVPDNFVDICTCVAVDRFPSRRVAASELRCIDWGLYDCLRPLWTDWAGVARLLFRHPPRPPCARTTGAIGPSPDGRRTVGDNAISVLRSASRPHLASPIRSPSDPFDTSSPRFVQSAPAPIHPLQEFARTSGQEIRARRGCRTRRAGSIGHLLCVRSTKHCDAVDRRP